MQHSARISSIRKRISALNMLLKSIQRRIDNVDRIISAGVASGTAHMIFGVWWITVMDLMFYFVSADHSSPVQFQSLEWCWIKVPHLHLPHIFVHLSVGINLNRQHILKASSIMRALSIDPDICKFLNSRWESWGFSEFAISCARNDRQFNKILFVAPTITLIYILTLVLWITDSRREIPL
jgi:hypothetical protein